jgi:hypothetical protein
MGGGLVPEEAGSHLSLDAGSDGGFLGRLVLAIQAVEHVKPLWGPLFGQQQYPAACFVELPSRVRLISRRTLRADARAVGDTVEAGGWESTGLGEPKDSCWFEMELTRKNAASTLAWISPGCRENKI